MKPQEQLDSITAEIDAHRKRLSKLLVKKAHKGIDAEAEIDIEIDQIKEQLDYLIEHERFWQSEVSFLKILSQNNFNSAFLMRRSKEILESLIPKAASHEDNSLITLVNDMYQKAGEHLKRIVNNPHHSNPEAYYLLARIFDRDEIHSLSLHYCCLCISKDPNHVKVREIRLNSSQFLLKNGDPNPQELKKYIIEDKAKLVEAGQFSEEMIWIELD